MFVHLTNHLRNKSRERVEEITGVSPKTPSTVDESIDHTDDTQSTTGTVSTIFSDNHNSSPLSRQVNKYRSNDNGGGQSPNIYFNEVHKLSKAIDDNKDKTNEMVSPSSSLLLSLLSL